MSALRLSLLTLFSLLLCGEAVVYGQVAHPTAILTVSSIEQQPSGSWDTGNSQVDFNGYVEVVNYAQFSTNASLASTLAAMFVRDYHSFGLYAKARLDPSLPNVITFQLVNGSSFGPLNIGDPRHRSL